MDAVRQKTISLLRWSEKYTKTDMVYLFNSVGWVFLGQLFTTITAMIVLVLLANVLDKDTLGIYRFAVSTSLILIVFALSGMSVALPQSVARGKFGNLRDSVLARIRWGFLGTVIGLSIAGYYFYTNQFELGVILLIVSLAVPFLNSFFSFFSYLQGDKQFDRSAKYHATGRAFFAIAIILVALTTKNAIALTVAFVVLTILSHYIPYRKVLREDMVKKHEKDEELIPYAKYLTLVGMPSFIAGNLDKFFIGILLGPSSLALYFVATTFSMESSRVGRIVAQAVLPKLSEKQSVNIGGFLTKLVKLEAILIIGWLIYALMAPLLFSIFFPLYIEVVGLSIIAMLALLFAPTYIIRSLLISQKRKKELNIMLIASPIIQMVAVIALIVLFGLIGAVIGTLIGLVIEMTIGILLLYFRGGLHKRSV